jgi:hypothetical protein
MSLLTADEIGAVNFVSLDRLDYEVFEVDQSSVMDFARAIEAAILAKLASAELPEPEYYVRNHGTFNQVEKYYYDAVHADERRRTRYTADQLRQAYAQGAASQLSAEPFTHYRNYDEQVQPFADENTVPLYTRKEAK